MTVIHLKKKDVVKSSVKGVAIEFDHLKLASILGIPGNNEICEYIKDVWEESKYTKPLEITRRGRDDVPEEEGPAENVHEEEEEGQTDFDWKAVVDETAVEKETEPSGVVPSGPSGHIPESVMNKLQAGFERARADRFQADLEEAEAKNVRLLALLQQAQSNPKP
ncbi:hypothetical protein Dimus_022621 [Dionaea muscipula]